MAPLTSEELRKGFYASGYIKPIVTPSHAIAAIDELKNMILENEEKLSASDAENMAKYSFAEISLARTLQEFAEINYLGDVAPLYLMLAKKLIDHGFGARLMNPPLDDLTLDQQADLIITEFDICGDSETEKKRAHDRIVEHLMAAMDRAREQSCYEDY